MRTARNMSFKPELIDELEAGSDARAVFERDGILDKLRLALTERFAERPPSLESEVGSSERFQMRYPELAERIVSLHSKGHSAADIQRRTSMLFGEPIPPAVI